MTTGAQDAYFWNAARETRNRITADPTLSIWEKSNILGRMNRIEADRNAERSRRGIPFRSVVNTLVGAGFGAAAAFAGSRFLGLPKPVHQAALASGVGLGGFMNSGMVKLNSERLTEIQKQAYKLGFVERAQEAGYFKKEALMIVSPSDATSLVRGPLEAGRGFAGRAGSVLSAASARNRGDADLAELEAEEELLAERLRELERRRQSRVVERVVGRR